MALFVACIALAMAGGYDNHGGGGHQGGHGGGGHQGGHFGGHEGGGHGGKNNSLLFCTKILLCEAQS